MNNMDDVKYKQHKAAKRHLDWPAIVEYSNTHSNKDTAKKFGCCPSMVTRIRNKMGAESRERTPNIASTVIDEAQAMRDAGEKIDYIAAVLNISRATVCNKTTAGEISRPISVSRLRTLVDSDNTPTKPVKIWRHGRVIGEFVPSAQ